MKKIKTYKRNFLSKVILRLDFDPIALNFLSDFSKRIKAQFPLEQQTQVLTGISVLDGKVEQSNTNVWSFSSANKLKKLEIVSTNIVLEYTSYKNAEELLSDVKEIITPFIETAKIETINRIGLRYINNIKLENIKTKINWVDYISKDLVVGNDFIEKTNAALARSMGQIVIKKDDADTKFVFGIFNNDFPNEVTRKEFLLDYDCYSKFPISAKTSEITDQIKKYNTYIQDLFEKSVTQKFRNLLNKK